MMYPYAEFLMDFDRKHGGHVHSNAPENTRAAVIIETRPFFFPHETAVAAQKMAAPSLPMPPG